MLIYFLYDSKHCYSMHSKRVEPILHGWSNKQVLDKVSATLPYFYFDQQSKKIFQAFQKLESFNFFC